MKIILASLLILIMSAPAIAKDSEITIFDEAQNAFVKFEDSEIAAWKKIDSQTAAFHEEWQKLNNLTRKRNRLVFLYKLQNEPDKIHWKSWKGWLRPVDSAAESDLYKKIIPEYKEITSVLDKQKEVFTAHNDLLVRRNGFYDKNKEVFTQLEKTLSDELSALERRMDKVRESQAQQNTAPEPQGR
jgi:hypothetical protein